MTSEFIAATASGEWAVKSDTRKGAERHAPILNGALIHVDKTPSAGPKTIRVLYQPDCTRCIQQGRGAFAPDHDPSPHCESGGRPHCTCNRCF